MTKRFSASVTQCYTVRRLGFSLLVLYRRHLIDGFHRVCSMVQLSVTVCVVSEFNFSAASQLQSGGAKTCCTRLECLVQPLLPVSLSDHVPVSEHVKY